MANHSINQDKQLKQLIWVIKHQYKDVKQKRNVIKKYNL